ncbi:MAG: hypothetical protein LBV74_14505 [Tannerella sp.]|jgi:hypothetical protein|nr:hypothetical protein [Tannerella sp.]
MGNAVNKIIAGNNITVSPTTGIGDVTISSIDSLIYNKSGTGNTVADLNFDSSTNTLTGTLGNRFEMLRTVGSGNAVSLISANGTELVQQLTSFNQNQIPVYGNVNGVNNVSILAPKIWTGRLIAISSLTIPAQSTVDRSYTLTSPSTVTNVLSCISTGVDIAVILASSYSSGVLTVTFYNVGTTSITINPSINFFIIYS